MHFWQQYLGSIWKKSLRAGFCRPNLRQKDKADKLGILDVRVLLNNKEQIDIEIQVTSSEYWAERTLVLSGKDVCGSA